MTLQDDPIWVQKVTRRAEQAYEAATAAATPPSEDPDGLWNRFDAMDTVADELHELVELVGLAAGLTAWLQSRTATVNQLLYNLIHEE